MFPSPQASTALSNFKPILDATLIEYKKKTGKELLDQPLATEVQRCDTVDAALAILRDQSKAFQQLKDGDQKFMERICPLTQVLFAFSGTLGMRDFGLEFCPAKGVIAAIAVLLSSAKDVRSSYDALVKLFERIENFFKPLGDYTQVSFTTEMAEVFVKITAEVVSILSIATREVTRWRAKIYIGNLLGRTDIEDALKTLDSLIQEQIRMATAQVMKVDSETKEDVKKANSALANSMYQINWNQKVLDVRQWFSPPDPSTNYNAACSVYHNVPSMWFFGADLFKDWMSNGCLLWVHGKSGSGKTILCSAIIQHIVKLRDAGQATLAYYYFDVRDKEKQNIRNFIMSIIVQFSEYSRPCSNIIHRRYLSYGNGMRQPSNDDLMDCLKAMLMVAAKQPVFIIIDSLDECSNAPGFSDTLKEILDVVKDLADPTRNLPRHPNLQENLRFCVTSRPDVDVQTKLDPLAVNAISLHGQSERKGDIANYVGSVVSLDENLKKLREEDKKLVIEELSERADGMFQWVFCQLETLRRSVQPDIRGVLEKLPKTLDETYERMLEDITENNREHARRLFHCLAVAVRPLRVEELAEILSFDFDEAPGGIPTFRRSENQIEAVLSACPSLIAIVNDGDSRVVQFSHLSVKEFLTSNHLASSSGDLSRFHILPKAAHTIFAQVCLGSLLRLEDHVDDDSESSKSFPLARYAAQHWVTHAQFEDVASSVEDGMLSLFDPDKPHFAAWVKTCDYDMGRQSDGKSQLEMPNPLYYAALCGLHDLVKHLAIKHPQHVNAIGGFYEFPLVAALCRRQFRAAEVLLAHGGTVDARGSGGETVLHKIIRLNEETIDAMRFLLDRGTDVNTRREDLSTPLHLAVVIGEPEVARIPDHAANTNSQNMEGLVPLHLLSRQDVPPFEDNRSIISTSSLESGADLNVQPKVSMTHLASSNRKFEIVRLLLDYGANADAENDEGRTPLQVNFRDDRFSQDGASVTQLLLLERGAEAYGREKYHVTASDLAFCFGKDKLGQVLLANSAEFGTNEDKARTAFHLWLKGHGKMRDKYDAILLHSASYYGRHEMAQSLLDDDINVNVKNHRGSTALHVVSRGSTALHVVSRGEDNLQEAVRVARLLLERGGEVNAENDDHMTPLHAASYYGRLDIAQLLLDHGANANAKDVVLRTPLHQVSYGEYESQETGACVAKLLLEHGADVNASDNDLWTPLHLASNKERPKIVQVLLEQGANANIKIDQGASPLHVVSGSKYSEDGVHVARLLLDHGADANARNNDHSTPLHEMSRFGRPNIVRVLLDSGAKANAEDRYLGTPLHAVSQGWFESQEDGVRTAQLLLERGVDVNARDRNRETPLHLATTGGKLEIVRVLLDHTTVKDDRGQTPLHVGLEKRDVDVDAQRQQDRHTPLHIACHRGSPDIAQLLLDHGANANAEDRFLRTPLHLVAEGHYPSKDDGIRVARLLLEHGVDITAQDSNRETPLHAASLSGRLEIARMLLERTIVTNDQGQNSSHLGLEERVVYVNARRKDHWTPLHLASHFERPEVVRLLLAHGANAHAEDDLLRTPLHQVARGHCLSQIDGVRVSQLLLECSADVNAQDLNRETPLHLASASGRLEIVRVLLEHVTGKDYRGQSPSHPSSEERRVDVNAQRTDGWTPLHVASHFGRLEIVRALLDHGASANVDVCETPLYLVSRGLHRSKDDGVCIARLLLERGGNANAHRKDHFGPLHAASYSGMFEIVRLLLDHGADVNAKISQGKNSLDLVSRGEYGSEEDGVRVAQLLMERGADLNALDKDQWTPLHSASYYGKTEIVRAFLDHGAKVNAETDNGETPLYLVSRGEYPSQAHGVRIARLLLDRGADLNGPPKANSTPLHWASYHGRLDIVRVLIDHGATINVKNEYLKSPLHAVSGDKYESRGDDARVAQLLLERGADVTAQDINTETPLHLAACNGKVELARVLLDHGAVATEKTSDGQTPLHAISRGDPDLQDTIRLARLLLERGADVNAPDGNYDTPLHSACSVGKLDIARELLDHDATVTAKNCRGETPLHVTSRGVYESQDVVRLVRLLLENGADVNAPDMENNTTLHFACRNGNFEIARLLLDHGAETNVKNNLGETPLHIFSTDSVRIARLLLEHGVDVDIHDKHHRTPLGVASFYGNLEVAQMLLDRGAAVNAKDYFGWTPLHLVSQYRGYPVERGPDIARLLLEHGADPHVQDVNHMTPLDLSSQRGWPKVVQVLLEHETKAKLA